MERKRRKALVADDDPVTRRILSSALQRAGYSVVLAQNGREAIDLVTRDVVVALLDLNMPEASGLECLRHFREHYPHTEVLMISGVREVKDVVAAMKEGAFDYITKPFDEQELTSRVQMATRAAQMARNQPEQGDVDGSPVSWPSTMTKVTVAKKMFERVLRVAELDSTVLISGESGSGKTMIARMVHQQGSRADKPFVAINCASLPRDLVEAELFGHARGAFTGAINDRPGRAEIAEGGTLFLDEISDLPIELQPKLLTFLQERTFQRVGSNKACRANVRVIAATHQDLVTMCRQKSFRKDLFFRLSVLTLHILPLRERLADIPDLAEEILEGIGQRYGCETPVIEEAAVNALWQHDWPGNIRELENVLERAWGFRTGPTITKEDLVFEEISEPCSDQSIPHSTSSPSGKTLAEMEKQAILDTLEECSGNKARAARQLGISEKSIYNKMKRHGLKNNPFHI